MSKSVVLHTKHYGMGVLSSFFHSSPTSSTWLFFFDRTRSRRSHFLFFITGTCCLFVCFIIGRLRSGILSFITGRLCSCCTSNFLSLVVIPPPNHNPAMSSPLFMGMLCHNFCYSSCVYIIADKALSMQNYNINSWQNISGYSIYSSWLNYSYATTIQSLAPSPLKALSIAPSPSPTLLFFALWLELEQIHQNLKFQSTVLYLFNTYHVCVN